MYGLSTFAEAPYAALPSISIGISGVSATGSIGNLVSAQTLSGVTATITTGNTQSTFIFSVSSNGNVGTVAVGERSISITGVSANGSSGVAAIGAILSGVSGTGSVTTFTVLPHWILVDDAQTVSWQNINTAGGNWSVIDTNTDPNWQIIETEVL